MAHTRYMHTHIQHAETTTVIWHNIELTFAGLHAFRPPVIDIYRRATTVSAGFPECSTPWTSYHTTDR